MTTIVRSLILSCVTCLSTLATGSLLAQVIQPGWGRPVFEENFDGFGIDQSRWEIGNWAASNNGELQYYHPDQASVQGGILRLEAERDPFWSHGREYNSGLLRTWQEWSYGRVEVRAKLPYGQGFWPAIWLLPRTAPWPAGGEIDIMEARGDRPWGVSSALHWGWDEPNHQHVANWYESGANFQQGFHTYAVEWDVGTVGFFVDGVEHFRLYEPAVGIPGTPKSIVLNLAVGGNFSGYPDGSTPFPSQFEIDYVRVWQRPEWMEPPTSLVRDPGFEEDDGALIHWPAFGNSIGNVSSDWGTPRDGARSLKLYGQFNGQENYSGVLQNFAIEGGERFVAGAHALTRSEDSVSGSDNLARMKVEFYSEAGAEYGSVHFLGEAQAVIADGNSPEDTWTSSEISAIAPAEAVEARMVFVFTQSSANPGGSVFVDSATLRTVAVCDFAAPYGVLDAADLQSFLTSLSAGNLETDLAAPLGKLDYFDVAEYLRRFEIGCP